MSAIMQTLSRSPGIGGTIKQSPESFIVREITTNGTMLMQDQSYSAQSLGEAEANDGKFAKIVLQKKNWETIRALQAIARALHRGTKSIGYAGMKDRAAITVQLASIFGVKASDVLNVKIKDISINSAWQSVSGVEMGDLTGNAFTILLEDAYPDNEKIDAIVSELDGIMPNYFDRQRFGMRLNNHRIGMHIMRGEHEAAVMEFLTAVDNERNEDAIMARKRLAGERDFTKALEYFPRYLRYERLVLDYLARYNNFANAIRKIPRGISLLFIHSVEDAIFNAELEKTVGNGDLGSGAALACSLNSYGFPDMKNVAPRDELPDPKIPVGNLVGYETDKRYMSEYEKEAMAEMGISKEMFKIKGMPELSMKGSFRALFAPFKGFSYEIEGKNVRLSFSLPAGSYATIFANEFSKNQGFEIKLPY